MVPGVECREGYARPAKGSGKGSYDREAQAPVSQSVVIKVMGKQVLKMSRQLATVRVSSVMKYMAPASLPPLLRQKQVTKDHAAAQQFAPHPRSPAEVGPIARSSLADVARPPQGRHFRGRGARSKQSRSIDQLHSAFQQHRSERALHGNESPTRRQSAGSATWTVWQKCVHKCLTVNNERRPQHGTEPRGDFERQFQQQRE